MWLIKNWNSSTIGGKEYTLVDEAGLRVMVNNDEDVTCASYITNINSIFIDRTEFNQDIGSWNTSNLINMINMFVEAFAFNQNQTGWCVTNILSQLSNFLKTHH